MPPPKKAAKKAAAKHAPHDDAPKDMRRAYEHLGRVEVLHESLDKQAATEVEKLTKLAQQELTAGHMKDAADLLRAAEHLSFGALGSQEKDARIDPKLVVAITKEFDGKLKKAEEHWSDQDQHPTVQQIYNAAKERARKSFDEDAYRNALELARAAEALAHVHIRSDGKLGNGANQHRLAD